MYASVVAVAVAAGTVVGGAFMSAEAPSDAVDGTHAVVCVEVVTYAPGGFQTCPMVSPSSGYIVASGR